MPPGNICLGFRHPVCNIMNSTHCMIGMLLLLTHICFAQLIQCICDEHLLCDSCILTIISPIEGGKSHS